MERLAAIASKSARAKDEHMADIAENVLESIRERMLQGLPMGIPTGFCELDRMTGGLRSGELAITGARTGMGKTSFALDIALHAAREIPVKFFSLEMAKRQLAPRALSFFSRVSLKRTVNADITEAELLSHFEAVNKLRELNIYAEFEAGMSIGEICAETHAFCARRGKALIIIDHLHYLRTDGKNYENRNIELGKITHALKELAKKLDIPILLLSQLNRDIDRSGSKDKSPRLSDLRDSGNIEQDADTVWFIHRPGWYEGSGIDPAETDIIVAKNRSGPTGRVKLRFDLLTAKFMDAGPKPSYSRDGYQTANQGGC
jgi:replicative DNA helicase